MPRDELDEWLEECDDRGPLFEAAEARVDAIVIDEASVNVVTERVRARMDGPRGSRSWRWLAVATLAAALVTVWMSAGSPTSPGPAPSTRPAVPAAARDVASPDAVAARRRPGAPPAYDPVLADAHRLLVEANLAAGDLDGAMVAVLDLAEMHGPPSHPRTPEELAATARLLRKVAVQAYTQARQETDPELLDRASVVYAVYLADFSEPEHDKNVRYAYGELLYEARRYDEAWEQYTAVAADPEHAKAQFCGESAVFAAEEMLKESDEPEVWRERFVDAADVYVETWPDDPKSVDMQYKAAYALYKAEDADAIERFESLAMQAPERREGGYAANLALDARVTAGDFAGAAAFAATFVEDEAVPEELRAKIAEVGGNAAYEAARRAVAEGADPAVEWAVYRETWPDGPSPP
ncbi:MAG: hypothetical protein AAF594_18340 [Bacteroidota bacterium]